MTLSRNHHPEDWDFMLAIVGRLAVTGAIDLDDPATEERVQDAVDDIWNYRDAKVFLNEVLGWADRNADRVIHDVQERKIQQGGMGF